MLALTLPDAPSPRICFDNGFLLDTISGWQKPMALPHDEKKAMLANAQGRRGAPRGGGRRQGARRDRELADLRDQRDVRAREQAVRRPNRRRHRTRPGQGSARRAARHRRGRRSDDGLRLPAWTRTRRGLGGTRRGAGAIRARSSVHRTRARTSTSSPPSTTRPPCSAKPCANAGCCRSKKRSTC